MRLKRWTEGMLEDLLQSNVLPNFEQYVDVTLREAYSGSSRHVNLNRYELCPKCLGMGANGLFELPCGKCRTTGWILRQQSIPLHIPAGIDTGASLHIPDNAPGAQPGGGYLVRFHVLADPMFLRNGNDLYTTLEISSALAHSGGEPIVILPDGKKIAFSLTSHAKNDQVISLMGRGMPYLNDAEGRRGTLYVKLRVAPSLVSQQGKGQPLIGKPPTAHVAPTMVDPFRAPVPSPQIPLHLGNYRRLHLLGEGGFAAVYLGEHTYLKTQAAIKVLKEQISPQALQTFVEEARTIATLKHPHIVRVLEFGVEGQSAFLVMDYAPLGTLRTQHPRGSVLPITAILPYIKQIAAALQYAHDRQIVHRDVKPENMLVDTDNSILLSDFGIALRVENQTQLMARQDAIGTISYMAPEQIQGKPRPASDQYALGIVVYEWLCGQYPFKGDEMAIAMQHINTSPPPLRTIIPTFPQEVEQAVLKALAKDHHQRFDSVSDFAAALEVAANA